MGHGAHLLFVAEIDGRIAGTTLLIFASEQNQAHCGHARSPDGTPRPTTFFYKQVG